LSLDNKIIENVLLGKGFNSSLLNDKTISEYEEKVVLVTGAAGSIGSELAKQLLQLPCRKLIFLDQAESNLYELQESLKKNNTAIIDFILGDIRDNLCLDNIFKVYKPHFIFHAAAYKHVPLLEKHPYEAVKTNVIGTKFIADKAVEFNAQKFVMISSDKAVNPTNVMGATKRIAELYVTHLNRKSPTKFIVTRFGNVLGSNGSVIPLFKRQIEEGGPLTVTHPEITRYFMTIPEACQLVLEAGAMGIGGEVFVFDMGESVKIMDLAKKIISLSGLNYPNDIDIQIVGLRPGEKIFEELLADGETTIKTHHKKIMIAKAKQASDDFEQKLTELISVENSFAWPESNNRLVKLIKEIVPEYLPF